EGNRRGDAVGKERDRDAGKEQPRQKYQPEENTGDRAGMAVSDREEITPSPRCAELDQQVETTADVPGSGQCELKHDESGERNPSGAAGVQDGQKADRERNPDDCGIDIRRGGWEHRSACSTRRRSAPCVTSEHRDRIDEPGHYGHAVPWSVMMFLVS